MFFMMALALIWPALGVVALVTGIYFARRHVRALERSTTDDAGLAELRQRLLQIEETLETTRRDVDRIEAGQEFTTRLLGERTTRTGPDAV